MWPFKSKEEKEVEAAWQRLTNEITSKINMTDNVAAETTLWNVPNYVVELFQVDQKKTPFLNMMGGLSETNAMLANPSRLQLPWWRNLKSKLQLWLKWPNLLWKG